MNKIKSIYISSAITFWLGALIFSVKQSINLAFTVWNAAAIGSVFIPTLFFAILLALKPKARTQPNLPWLTVLISSTTIVSIVGFLKASTPIYFVLLSVVSEVLWLGYTNWYSALPVPKIGLKIGQTLPILSFFTYNNLTVTLDSFGSQNKILLFYRGNWCPLCMAQVKEIAKAYKQLIAKGTEVFLISPQPAGHTEKLARKLQVDFHFLVDKGNATARKLGIDHPHGTPLGMEVFGYKSETVLPTVLITDAKNIIRFIDQTDNYRVRPEPEFLMREIDKIESLS